MPKLAGVQWTGLDTFYDELRLLPANLVDEAQEIMRESAEAAKADIAAAYPHKTGALARGLTLTPARGTLLAGFELRQTAPHGWIYEHGTTVRETTTGANRGQMHGRAVFEPRAHAYRRSAISAVMFRLYAHGAARVVGGAEEEEG
jgi:hypothetical protein